MRQESNYKNNFVAPVWSQLLYIMLAVFLYISISFLYHIGRLSRLVYFGTGHGFCGGLEGVRQGGVRAPEHGGECLT